MLVQLGILGFMIALQDWLNVSVGNGMRLDPMIVKGGIFSTLSRQWQLFAVCSRRYLHDCDGDSFVNSRGCVRLRRFRRDRVLRDVFLEKNRRNGVYSLLPSIAVAALHLAGNIHYQIYCGAGVIPEENCYWMMNAFSFLAGASSVFAIGIVLAMGTFTRWLCCKQVRVVRVVSRGIP